MTRQLKIKKGESRLWMLRPYAKENKRRLYCDLAQDAQGRWWVREYRPVTVGWRNVMNKGPWTLMGDLEPITGDEPPFPGARLSPRHVCRLPQDHLTTVLKVKHHDPSV